MQVDAEDGPVLTTVEYDVPAERLAEFTAAAGRLRRVRRREGALQWALFEDVQRQLRQPAVRARADDQRAAIAILAQGAVQRRIRAAQRVIVAEGEERRDGDLPRPRRAIGDDDGLLTRHQEELLLDMGAADVEYPGRERIESELDQMRISSRRKGPWVLVRRERVIRWER